MTEVPIERALNRDILIELLEKRDSEGDDRWNINQINPICFATRFKISQLWEARRNYDLNRVNFTFFPMIVLLETIQQNYVQNRMRI